MASRRAALPLAFMWALFAFYSVHFLDFRGSVPNFEAVSNGGVLLDVAPAFGIDAIYGRLEGYGEEGRENYAFRNATVDVALPLSLLPFLWLLMRAVTRWIRSRTTRLALLSIPFIYVIFDLAENAAVVALLSTYPTRMRLLAAFVPYVTTVKRVASLLALVAPVALFILQWRGRRKPVLV